MFPRLSPDPHSSELGGRVTVAAGAATRARLRNTRKTPLPPATRSRRTTNPIPKSRGPWGDVAAGGWLPAMVPSVAVAVLEGVGVLPLAMAVPEGVGVLPTEGVGVGVSVVGTVLMGAGVGLGG